MPSSLNVYVRAAVMASCAVPSVFPPVMLWPRTSMGNGSPSACSACTGTNQVDLGSRRGLPGFVPGLMTGLPPEFYTLKTPQWLALNARREGVIKSG